MLKRAWRDLGHPPLSISIAGRLARLFLEMAAGQHDLRPRLTMALTHEELASILGTTRESVTRVISGMKRKQMIAIQGASMTILRKDALELLV